MHFVSGWIVHDPNLNPIISYHDRVSLLLNLFLQEGSSLVAVFGPRPVMIFPLEVTAALCSASEHCICSSR